MPGQTRSRSADISLGSSLRSRTCPSSKKQRHCGREADHVYVVVEVTIGFGEDLAQDGGLDEDGGAHVEAEALLIELCGLSAEPGVFLEDLDLVPAGGEGAGGGETCEAGADDADVQTAGCVLLDGCHLLLNSRAAPNARLRPLQRWPRLPAWARRMMLAKRLACASPVRVVVPGAAVAASGDDFDGGHLEQAFGAAGDAEAAVTAAAEGNAWIGCGDDEVVDDDGACVDLCGEAYGPRVRRRRWMR